jgi:hypothetical protein
VFLFFRDFFFSVSHSHDVLSRLIDTVRATSTNAVMNFIAKTNILTLSEDETKTTYLYKIKFTS